MELTPLSDDSRSNTATVIDRLQYCRASLFLSCRDEKVTFKKKKEEDEKVIKGPVFSCYQLQLINGVVDP